MFLSPSLTMTSRGGLRNDAVDDVGSSQSVWDSSVEGIGFGDTNTNSYHRVTCPPPPVGSPGAGSATEEVEAGSGRGWQRLVVGKGNKGGGGRG